MKFQMLKQEQEKITIESNFARTCNRFSQFLKQRRSSGDIDVFTSLKGDTDLRKSTTQILTKSDQHMNVNKSLDLFPLTSNSSSTRLGLQESNDNMVESRKSSKSSMTIFYDGKMVVYEDIEEEMAKEIMSLASKSEKKAIATNLTHGLLDLPIARRASLHRFMEKRKNRIAACGPYQIKSSSSEKELYKQQEEDQLELKLW